MTQCPACGKPMAAEARFCPSCGAPSAGTPAPSAARPTEFHVVGDVMQAVVIPLQAGQEVQAEPGALLYMAGDVEMDAAARRAGPAQHRRRRHRGQRRESRARSRDAPEAGADRAGPRARAHRLPARGPAAQGALPAGRRARRSAAPAGRGRGASRSSGSRSGRATLQRAAVVADGRVQAVYRKRFLPNYGVFDEARYFQAGDAPRWSSSPARASACRLRGHLVRPAPPASDVARAGSSLILTPRRRTTAARATGASGCSIHRAPTTAPPSRSATRSAARTSWSSTAARRCSTRRRGHRPRAAVRGGPAVATVDLQAVLTARLRDTRLRPPVRARAARGAPPRPLRPAAATSAPPPPGGAWRRCSSPRRRSTRRSCSARATTSTRTASARRDRAVRRHRLGADAAIAADALGADRVTGVTLPSRHSSCGHARRREGAGREPRHRAARDRRSAGGGGLRRAARRRCSPAASPTSPRRTSRPGSAATC